MMYWVKGTDSTKSVSKVMVSVRGGSSPGPMISENSCSDPVF